MKRTRIQRLFGSFLWLVSGVALGASAAAEGQTTPSDETPAVKPTVSVERQGPMLVLTYRLLGPDGEPYGQRASGSQPAFTIHRGKREIASGRFAYG